MKPLFPSLLIFDLANLVWRTTTVKIHGGELTTSDGRISGHVFRTCNSILAAKKNFGGDMYFVTEGMEVDRFKLHPDYKAGRASIKDEFNPFPDILEMISHIRCSFITPTRAEADDGIATLCREKPNARITIVSCDRDLWTCLHNKKVTIRKNKDNIYQAQAQKEFKVQDLRAIPLVKALYGDSSDNIPSVPRLRKADVHEVLQECLTPDDLYGKLDRIKEKTRDKLVEYEQQVRTMFQVTTLKTCEYTKQDFSGDLEGLQKFLQHFECNSLLNKITPLVDPNAP